MCGDQGYDHTILSNKSQAEVLKRFFNTTLDLASLNTSDYSFPLILDKLLKKFPKCKASLRKMFCVDYLPPCFPGKPKQNYGLCKSDCNTITNACPEFFRYYPEDLEFCADFPDGERFNGFCAYSSWPRSAPYWFSKYNVYSAILIGPRICFIFKNSKQRHRFPGLHSQLFLFILFCLFVYLRVWQLCG